MIYEVEDCYEFGQRSGEFYEVGDLVGLLEPHQLEAGHYVSKGEVTKVIPDKRRVRILSRRTTHYPLNNVQFSIGYDKIYLIKENGEDEEVDRPSKKPTIENVVIISE